MIRQFTRRAFVIGGMAVAALLVPAGAAFAQDDTYPTPSSAPTVSSVGGVSAEAPTQDPGTGTSQGAGDPGGTLPVTGGQLAGLTLAGLAIVGAGIALIVAARRPRRARIQV